jgi:hypothetical protein
MPIEFEYTTEGNEDIEEEVDEEETEEDEDDESDDEDEEEIEEISESEEIEEIEFDMTEDNIDEWINELIKLKSEGKSINLQIDENLFLKINYDEEEEE